MAPTSFTVTELGALLCTKAKDFLDAKSVLPTRKAEVSRESWSQKEKKKRHLNGGWGWDRVPSVGRLNRHPN